MKKIMLILLIFSIASLMLFSCSDPQDDLAMAPKIGIHSAGFGKPGAPDFHSKYFMQNEWNLKFCIQCHAADYSGGTAGVGCNTCHSQTNGPEACNTCHGDFADADNIAPPRDVNGNIETTAKGVGAHQSHTLQNMRSPAVSCYECHPSQVPAGEKYVFGHVGSLPAEISFGEFANKSGDAVYDFSALTCSNTYCHGKFEFLKSEASFPLGYAAEVMTGNNYNPIWNKVDGTEARCGTCHGQWDSSGNLITAAPSGHIYSDLERCGSCHYSQTAYDIYDKDGNVVNKLKHVNGEKNIFGL